MAGRRGVWRSTGLLGIAVAAAFVLAACGTASGLSGTAAGPPTTATGPAASSGGTAGAAEAPGAATTVTTAGPGAGPAASSGGTAGAPATTTAGSSQSAPSSAAPGSTSATVPAKPAKPKAAPKLHLGDKGKSVLALQHRLAGLGYQVPEPDGQFGPETSHAVVAFQKVNKLDRDGVVGPQTVKALADPRVPRPHLGGKGLHLEADLTLQVVYVVDNGKILRILDSSSASGRTYVSEGETRIAHTPEGSFKIERKTDGWRRSNLGLLYRPAYFVGGYALHGAPSVPPFPASHGCIRLTTTSMDWLYPKLVLGTRVLVYRS